MYCSRYLAFSHLCGHDIGSRLCHFDSWYVEGVVKRKFSPPVRIASIVASTTVMVLVSLMLSPSYLAAALVGFSWGLTFTVLDLLASE